MELILREDVEHLGRRGEVVQVKGGYGRNFLLPRKLAMVVTSGNRKVVEQQKTAGVKRDAREQSDAQQLAGMLGQVVLSIARKAGESGVLFGSVTSLDVAEALHKKGFEIDRRKIHLEEPLKQLGEFQVPVRLHKDVTVPVQVQVVPEES
ncbi:MAG: 50S ribosomal protein L9 [Acidobacteria bacterium RIFCSPLOWO2_02_FULL_60_20]|nr:MAG: 50S ribosomal protein L9 [Acidobacteria bacterium RIFCSPLOWO2_02_FULL_60_20]